MHGFGHSGKSKKIFEGPSSRTRSKTSEKGKDYCNCPKSPETAIDKPRAGSRDLTHTAKMANVGEKLAQLQDLFNKRYDQIGETLESVQASLNEPSNSAPVKAKLESFSGYENQDINRWLVKFSNRLALRHKKSDPKAAAADLSFHLAGPAETWYYSLDPSVRDNYDALKAALLKRFSNQDLEWRLRQKLSSRKQGESESLDTYVDFLSNTCQRLGVSDQDKMHYFVQGLREDIKRDVLMQKPKTFEEAESVARLKVSVERTLLDDRSSVPNSDPEKAVLYKMLENLMPNSKEPKSDASAKVAAFVPQKAPDLGMEFQKLRTELSREIRDELRAVKDGICNNQGPQGGKFFPPNNHMGYSRDPTMGRRNFQGGGGRDFAGGGNNIFQRGGRRLDGKPVCFRCNRTGHVARNCQVNVSMRDQYNPRKPPNPHRQDPRIAVLRNDTCHAPDYNGDTCHPFAPSLDDTMVTEPEVVPWEPAPHAGTCPESPCVTPIQQQLDPNKVTPVAANQLHQDDVPKEPEETSSTVMENNPSVLQFSENTFNIPKDLSVKGEALGFTVNCLVDTGAAISVISTEFLHKSHEGRKLKLKDSQIKTVNTVSGEQLVVLGQVSVPIKIQSNLYECEAHVISNLGYDLVLGRYFLRKTKAVIDLGDNTLRLQISILLTIPEIVKDNDFCVLEYITPLKYNISNTCYVGPLTRSDLALVSCPDRRFLLPVGALDSCFQDDTTLVCPHSVLRKTYGPDWLGLPWTPSTKMSFPRLHSAALDCSNLHPLFHLGGRHYLSTTSSTLLVNGLTNRSTLHLSPLMVYHFPCEVTFPEQQTGFGACPSRLEITVLLFTPTHINYIPWHAAMDNSVLDLHYQSLNIPPPSTFNRSTLDSLDKTFQTLDGHLDYKLDKIRQDINHIQETSTTSLNDALTYAAFGLALLNTMCFCFLFCRFVRSRSSNATQNSTSTTKTLVATTQDFIPPQCEHCHKPRRQTSAPL